MTNDQTAGKHLVIFTDLDGTLLDRETYSWKEAWPAIEAVKAKRTPLVFCSAKTRAEQEVIREELGIHDPFIVEDGGAVYIEDGYFDFRFESVHVVDGYRMIEFGLPYEEIRKTVKQVAAESGLYLRGYGDMDAEEVAKVTGLDLESAERAKKREYEVQLVGDFDSTTIARLTHVFRSRSLHTTHGGRFFGVMTHSGKGSAVLTLIAMFRKQFGEIITVGIGDSGNDAPMLKVVDIPVLVQKPGGTWEPIDLPNINKVKGIGPVGWRRFVLELLS
jgi:mannosyl-3-phosphoglycerate phosphatase